MMWHAKLLVWWVSRILEREWGRHVCWDVDKPLKYLIPSLFWADSAHLNLNTITSMDEIAFNLMRKRKWRVLIKRKRRVKDHFFMFNSSILKIWESWEWQGTRRADLARLLPPQNVAFYEHFILWSGGQHCCHYPDWLHDEVWAHLTLKSFCRVFSWVW